MAVALSSPSNGFTANLIFNSHSSPQPHGYFQSPAIAICTHAIQTSKIPSPQSHQPWQPSPSHSTVKPSHHTNPNSPLQASITTAKPAITIHKPPIHPNQSTIVLLNTNHNHNHPTLCFPIQNPIHQSPANSSIKPVHNYRHLCSRPQAQNCSLPFDNHHRAQPLLAPHLRGVDLYHRSLSPTAANPKSSPAVTISPASISTDAKTREKTSDQIPSFSHHRQQSSSPTLTVDNHHRLQALQFCKAQTPAHYAAVDPICFIQLQRLLRCYQRQRRLAPLALPSRSCSLFRPL